MVGFSEGVLGGLSEVDLREVVFGLRVIERRVERDPLLYFRPLGGLVEFWNSRDKVQAVFGGNRSGKTYHGAAKVVRSCLDNARQVCWAATLTMEKSREVQQKKVWEFLPQDSRVAYGKYTSEMGFVHNQVRFGNGSIIRFKSFDQGARTFGGESCDLIWLDEEAEDRAIKDQCLMRLIEKRGSLILTLTPENGMTWVYDDIYLNNGRKGIRCWFASIYDNVYLTKREIDLALSNIGDVAVRDAKAYGKFVRRQGLVYKGYTDEYPHVLPNKIIPVHYNRYRFIDPHPRKPHSCIWAAVCPSNFYYVYDELTYEGKISDFAEQIKIKTDMELKQALDYDLQHKKSGVVPEIIRTYIDTSANTPDPINWVTIKQELFKCGIRPIVDVRKGPDTIVPGILNVQQRFALDKVFNLPSLYFFERCYDTRKQHANLVFDDPKKDNEKKGQVEKPKKINDDKTDLVRYLCFMNLKYKQFIPEYLQEIVNGYKPNYEAVV